MVCARRAQPATQGNSPVYELYSVTLRSEVTGKLDDCAEAVDAGLGARPYADGVIIDPWTGEIDAKQTARLVLE